MNNPEWTPIPGFTGYEFHPVLGVRSYRRKGRGVNPDYTREPHAIAAYIHQGNPHVCLRDDAGKVRMRSLRSLIGLVCGPEARPRYRKRKPGEGATRAA